MANKLDINCPVIDLDNYEIRSVINSNSSCTSLEATDKNTRKRVIIECDLEKKQEIINIINISNMGIQGIVPVIGYILPLSKKEKRESKYFDFKVGDKSEDLTGFITVREFYNNGSLEGVIIPFLRQIKSIKIRPNPTNISKIIFGIAAIMRNLHSNKVIHGDLNLKNILLDDRLEPIIQIIRSSDESETDNILIDSPYYMAPERIDNDEDFNLNFPVDVFSYAIILYQMFEPNLVFEGQKQQLLNRQHSKITRLISNGARLNRTKSIPDHYWELIQNCWKQEPEERYAFNEIVAILKNDKFAIEGTDLNQLHEYQSRIVENELQRMEKRLKLYDEFFSYPKLDETKLYIEDEDNYELVDEIKGKDTRTTNYLVIDNRNSQKNIKKVLNLTKDSTLYNQAKKSIEENEKEYLINYPCFIQIYGIELQSNDKNIITFFSDSYDISLFDFLQGEKKNYIFSPTLKVRMVIEIVHAMRFLHRNKILYNFLNLKSILLNSVYDVKIENVGFQRTINICDDPSESSFVYNDKTSKKDVDSFGRILYSIFTGTILSDIEVLPKVKNSDLISQQCIDLINECTQNNYYKRPSFDKILDDIRNNEYKLISYFDPAIIQRRDNELEYLENHMTI